MFDIGWLPPAEWYEHGLESRGKRRCQGCREPFIPDPRFKKQFWCQACRDKPASEHPEYRDNMQIRHKARRANSQC